MMEAQIFKLLVVLEVQEEEEEKEKEKEVEGGGDCHAQNTAETQHAT